MSKPRWLTVGIIMVIVSLVAVACGDDATPVPVATQTPQIVEVTREVRVEVTKEVPVEVTKEVIVVQTVEVTKEVVVIVTPTPTPGPPPGSPVVNRLKVAMFIFEESVDPQISAGHSPQIYPMFDALVRLDSNYQLEQMLSTGWEASPDLTTWTFNLREGVQWQKGYGEFDADDVVHTIERGSRDEAFAWSNAYFAQIKDDIEVPDPYTITFNLPSGRLDFAEHVSTRWFLLMLSKDHFDAEGQDGVENNPVGTGPYQNSEWRFGEYQLLERVPYEHYRVTPDFNEVQIFPVSENATRLAMLLTGAVHMARIPTDLENTAIDGGMTVIPSSSPTITVWTAFGGLWQEVIPEGNKRKGEQPDLPYSDLYHGVDEVPWVHRKVRKALNHAVNREEINETLLGGLGEPMYVPGWHADIRGFNPQWVENFEEDYGYDPDLARQLLAEVEAEIGHPLDWSKTVKPVFNKKELSNLGDVGEAIANYWSEVGVDITLEQSEWNTLLPNFFVVNLGGVAFTNAVDGFRDPNMVNITFYSAGPCCHLYENPAVDVLYEELVPVSDLTRRDELLRDIGNILYDDYVGIPLFWLPFTVVVNPNVVEDYRSTMTRGLRDLEYVVAVKTE